MSHSRTPCWLKYLISRSIPGFWNHGILRTGFVVFSKWHVKNSYLSLLADLFSDFVTSYTKKFKRGDLFLNFLWEELTRITLSNTGMEKNNQNISWKDIDISRHREAPSVLPEYLDFEWNARRKNLTIPVASYTFRRNVFYWSTIIKYTSMEAV
jgi:hypothetical protein